MAKNNKLSDEQKAELRRAAAEKRRTITAALKSKNAVDRAEMLAAIGGPLRTVDGHVLSENNSLIIALQAAAAGVSLSMVGGFRQWKSNGRIVKKGQKGFCFWYPLAGGAAVAGAGDDGDDGDGDDGDGDNGTGRRRFGTAYYWDVSQTEEIGAAGAGDGDDVNGYINGDTVVSAAVKSASAVDPAVSPAVSPAAAVQTSDSASALLAAFAAA